MTTVFKIEMSLERETKGAVRYRELDDTGQPCEEAFGKVNTFYVRKTAFERGKYPAKITVTVEA
jgi:hypothetical protein